MICLNAPYNLEGCSSKTSQSELRIYNKSDSMWTYVIFSCKSLFALRAYNTVNKPSFLSH